jgi:hypothetical protein
MVGYLDVLVDGSMSIGHLVFAFKFVLISWFEALVFPKLEGVKCT